MSQKLVKELNKVQEKSYQELNDGKSITDQVEQLLLGYAHEEEAILTNAGFTKINSYEKKLTEDYRRTKVAEQIYKKQSFTGLQIKQLCNTYDLKLLQTKHYRGSIDSSLSNKIKEFSEATGLPINDYNMFVLAPTSAFNVTLESAMTLSK